MDEELQDQPQEQAKPEDINPLVKLAICAVIGLLMWVMFGRIGGHPFPH